MQTHLDLRATMAGIVAALLVSAAAFATPIDDKYNALGGAGSFLGAPTISESTAPDGVGKYRHYAGGSIYWHPQTGAHEVHGLIRQFWASLGWEKSYLGYPMTDEIDTFDGGGRVSKFQGGELIWRKATNKVSEVKSTDLIIDLPFAANEPWEIIQANAASTSDSHGGPWAYCWDFILAGKAQSQSNGHTFVSVADGQILYAEQTFPAGPGNPPTSGNVVIQRLGVGRYASYLHIKTGSYTKHFGSGSMFLPQAMPGSGPIAKSGVVLAEVGDSGAGAGAYHLHFCVTTKPDRPQFKPFESVPVAFRNYSVSTDGGNKWTFVTAGVPRNAQWVRRENKGGPTGPQVNANASVLNVGTVSGQITSLNGKAGASGGTMSVSIISEWGESVASKTINIPANSAGPWPYSIGNVPAFNDLKAAALYKGSWTVPADLIAGEGGSFALAPNGTAASNIQLKATAIK